MYMGYLILIIYIVLHLPALALIIVGLAKLSSRPDQAKSFLILGGIYFLIGGGICSAFLS